MLVRIYILPSIKRLPWIKPRYFQFLGLCINPFPYGFTALIIVTHLIFSNFFWKHLARM